jgi:uncharacterized protein (TIGR02594 family)
MPQRKKPKAKAPILVASDGAPPWLSVMRAITGTTETPGDADNPKILAMRDEIKRIWADVEGLPAYADSYQHDETPWCGLTAAFCVSEAGYMPAYKPLPADDTERFYWAQAWASDDHYVELSGPVLGAIMVMTREGGGHISLVEDWDDDWVSCRGGNQSDAVNVQSYDRSDVIGYFWPSEAPMPDVPRRDLEQGDQGTDVAALQVSLGVHPADGDFGSITDSAVKGYQAACSISVDGQVGSATWAKIDELDAKVAKGNDGLPDELISAIVDAAENSAIARYQWRDRGQAPLGYTAGVALCFALALDRLDAEDDAAYEMAQANTGDDTDVFEAYAEQFDNEGMDNGDDVEAPERLRHLFALMLGLGMRESSGRYSEGRDQSASNTSADSAEAGCWQTSWDIRSCSGNIPPLLTQYWNNPNGFRAQFQKGVSLKSSDLGNYGSGPGAQYQFLSKYAPSFHALVTALGLRSRCNHWGPINRGEAELKAEADSMLHAVQMLVEGGVQPEPEPEPEPGENRVDITAPHPREVEVTVTGDVVVTMNGEPLR